MQTRRHFLRSSSTVLALPLLQSLSIRATAAESSVSISKAPKRLVFLGMGYGVTEEHWYPDRQKTGANWELPEVLSPLTKHQKDLTLIQNLHHKNSRDGHAGSTFWLTGADQYGVPGQSFHNTVSVDQVAAEHFGQHTRFPSLQMDADNIHSLNDGHGHGGSLAWSRQGKPISSLPNPAVSFHRLFSADNIPLEKRISDLKNQRSILDTVVADARGAQKGLTATDRDKLEEYLNAIRDIEKRIAKEESWLDVPRKLPNPVRKKPPENMDCKKAMEVNYDLMVAAMQVDASRILSSRLPANSFIKSLGAEISAHDMSHYGNDSRKGVSKRRDHEHARLLAGFFDKLKHTKEADGSTLFENVTIVFGSNLSKTHNLSNCPTIVAGGGSGFTQGRHLVAKKDTPLCNLWLSLLQRNGIEIDQFGDSTEPLAELA